MTAVSGNDLKKIVRKAIQDVEIIDIHTHIYAPCFGGLLLWGIDEQLVYHYLLAEAFRWLELPYEDFWALPKAKQADLIWQSLFLDHSPLSESTRGVLTTLEALGFNLKKRNLASYRKFFAGLTTKKYVDLIFHLTGIKQVVMTNDPFDDLERPIWEKGCNPDPRFKASLRIDPLLREWDKACARLAEWGYRVHPSLNDQTRAEVRRFLTDWFRKTDALYCGVSLPPEFVFPDDSPRTRLIEDCVLPVCRELDKPLSLMIGVQRQANPHLRLAGDCVGRGDINSLEYLCRNFPQNKFMTSWLGRENQHEVCVAARKFRNLLPFGCWWFTNIPLLIEEITRMRFELLGPSFIPQHSDARVLDQLIYKWAHSKKIIGDLLVEKYQDIMATGWLVHKNEIQRDVESLFGGNFQRFLKMKL